MHLNPAALPTMLLAGILYRLGIFIENKVPSKRWLLLGAVVLALPAFACALYYTHLFDSAAWFYRFRAAPYTEMALSGCGLLAGILNSWFAPEALGEKLIVPTGLLGLMLIPFVKPCSIPLISTAFATHAIRMSACKARSPLAVRRVPLRC